MESYDAVIIGAGPNALVNAAYLTKAGWSVLILDRNDRPGGGLRTQEITLPGFVHDVYAGFLILFAISAAYADLAPDLATRGLTMANSDTPAGVSLHDGSATILTTDMAANMAEAERLAPGDGDGVGENAGRFGRTRQRSVHAAEKRPHHAGIGGADGRFDGDASEVRTNALCRRVFAHGARSVGRIVSIESVEARF